MVGPWQVPVADCATTLLSFEGYAGEAFAMGERTPIAVIDGPASGRMAVAEALTNLAAAPVESLSRVKLSANWMAAAGSPGEDAALFDTVKAVALDLCPRLGVGIPVGKDSMSMRTTWEEGGQPEGGRRPAVARRVGVRPLPRRARRPGRRSCATDRGETDLVFVDLAGGPDAPRRLDPGPGLRPDGGRGARTSTTPSGSRGLYAALAELRAASLVLAYHDRSDGGLFATLAEMAFAGHTGRDARRLRRSRAPRPTPPASSPRSSTRSWASLLQSRTTDRARVLEILARHGVPGRVARRPERRRRGADHAAAAARSSPSRRIALHRLWSETTWQMQTLRDNPESARAGVRPDPRRGRPRPRRRSSPSTPPRTWPRRSSPAARGRAMAILREQGVNGQVEMAAAFDRAGFESIDVHMSDVIAGRVSLADFKGFAACGGFSYGDVLGGGEGWAKSILFNPRARDEFAAFFARTDSFALGVCNGCQMMSALHELIPGAEAWPRFVKNRSEQFEARLVLVEIPESPSLFFARHGRAAGSRW